MTVQEAYKLIEPSNEISCTQWSAGCDVQSLS